MTRGALLDVAATVAWRFCAYRSYAQDTNRAIQAIRRNCPGFSRTQYENALQSGIRLYEHVKRFVDEHAASIYKDATSLRKNPRYDQGIVKELIKGTRAEFPGFWISSIRMMIGMNFYYWHLR